MPRIDFGTIEDAKGYSILPEAGYRCRFADIEETSTQYGDDMWKLTLMVAAGDYEGRRIFDNMVFSDRALARVKLICAALGIDVSGSVDLVPAMLLGKECNVTVEIQEYEDSTGKLKQRNSVPFAGYAPIRSEHGE